MDTKGMMKMALIAGAAEALKYKREHPRASDEEALQHVNRQSSAIVSTVGTDQ
jgi:hypothetical protein